MIEPTRLGGSMPVFLDGRTRAINFKARSEAGFHTRTKRQVVELDVRATLAIDQSRSLVFPLADPRIVCRVLKSF